MVNSSEEKIEGVSDTALWVAHFRALETQRPAALFRDPLAAKLVGDRGKRLAESMPMPKIMDWIMVLRTCAIDRLILQAIEAGADTVVNLGAGMDTRPYRMELPASLRWVEIDLPHSVTYKNEKLNGEKPVCLLERISLDLEKQTERKAVFQKLAAEAKTILIITEGLIPYLSREEVSTLATELHQYQAFRFWVQDYNQGGFFKRVPKMLSKKMKMAPFRFYVEDWFDYFKSLGWRSKETITLGEEAKRQKRPFPFLFPWSLLMPFAPKRFKEERQKMSGYTLLERF